MSTVSMEQVSSTNETTDMCSDISYTLGGGSGGGSGGGGVGGTASLVIQSVVNIVNLTELILISNQITIRPSRPFNKCTGYCFCMLHLTTLSYKGSGTQTFILSQCVFKLIKQG